MRSGRRAPSTNAFVALAAPGVLIPVPPETARTDRVEGRRSGDRGAGAGRATRRRHVALGSLGVAEFLPRPVGQAPRRGARESAAASGRWASGRLSPAQPVRADSTATLQAI